MLLGRGLRRFGSERRGKAFSRDSLVSRGGTSCLTAFNFTPEQGLLFTAISLNKSPVLNQTGAFNTILLYLRNSALRLYPCGYTGPLPLAVAERLGHDTFDIPKIGHDINDHADEDGTQQTDHAPGMELPLDCPNGQCHQCAGQQNRQ